MVIVYKYLQDVNIKAGAAMFRLRSESLNHYKLIKRKFRLIAIQNLVILKAFQQELSLRENGKTNSLGYLNVRQPSWIYSCCTFIISSIWEVLKLHHYVHRDGFLRCSNEPECFRKILYKDKILTRIDEHNMCRETLLFFRRRRVFSTFFTPFFTPNKSWFGIVITQTSCKLMYLLKYEYYYHIYSHKCVTPEKIVT